MSSTQEGFQNGTTAVDTDTDYQAFRSKPDRACTSIFYINLERVSSPLKLQELITQSAEDFHRQIDAVCIIENISPTVVEALTASWQVDSAFFAKHVSTAAPEHFFQPRRWALRSLPAVLDMEPKISEHLDGIYEYVGPDSAAIGTALRLHGAAPNYCERRWLVQDRFPPQSHTRMSYCRVNTHLCKSEKLQIR